MNKELKGIGTEQLHQQYQDLIHSYSTEKQKIDKQSLWVSVIRLAVFILLAFFVYLSFKSGRIDFWIVSFLLLVIFLFLMKYHAKLFTKRNFLKRIIQINKEEIQALKGDYSAFAEGSEFEIPAHDFSLDLDVFGKDSLFQMLNRTSTSFGARKLANWFNIPLLSSNEILERQDAVKELEPLLEFRQFFRTNGLSVKESNSEYEFLSQWKNQLNLFYPKLIFKILIYLVPIVNIGAIGLFSFDILSGKMLAALLILTLGFVGIYTPKIHKIHQNLSKRTALLEKYVKLFSLMENQEFNSNLLQQLQQNLKSNKQKASGVVKELSKILSALDTRLNVFAGILLNAIFIWDIRQVYRIEAWQNRNIKKLDQWFDIIAQMDALISLANNNYNHPQWVIPEISDTEKWHLSELRHPLMKTLECVSNDFIVSRIPYLKVITGANMAGKSTYLRTVGSNLLLAMLGTAVHAKSMTFYPIQIMSSLRTTDSLMKSESYFYAEIKRLQMIVNRLRDGEKLFVLLDEILKGTNSKDKEEGSRALLQQLIKLQTVGVIATHDLSLGKLSDEYDESIENQCFEVDIINDQLSFDYKIRPGIAQNMNASFLLKKMGIV